MTPSEVQQLIATFEQEAKEREAELNRVLEEHEPLLRMKEDYDRLQKSEESLRIKLSFFEEQRRSQNILDARFTSDHYLLTIGKFLDHLISYTKGIHTQEEYNVVIGILNSYPIQDRNEIDNIYSTYKRQRE